MRKLCCLLIVSLNVTIINGQTKPAEGAKLNYRLAEFSIPAKGAPEGYQFMIAKGKHEDEQEFIKNLIIKQGSERASTVIKLPSFGTSYTWRAMYKENGKEIKTPLHHFSTDTSRYVDPTKYRMRVLSNNYADSNNLFFFLDYARCLYDMKGEPVWFLPDIPPLVNSETRLRDLKMTGDGHLSFLVPAGILEVDYAGQVTRAIVDDTSNKGDKRQATGRGGGRNAISTGRFYHHELTKMKNGHYLCMGNEYIRKKLPYTDSNILNNEWGVEKEGMNYYKNLEMGTVLELDAQGDIVWQWKCSEYFTDRDIFLSFKPGVMYNTTVHMNAAYLDEKDSMLYVGFRDISRILKIKYPEGTVIASYNGLNERLQPELFSMQHSIGKTKEGDLYIFNNNVDPVNDPQKAISSIVVLKEPRNVKEKIKKIWEFRCNIDGEAPSVGLRGGNTVELADGTFLTCMGGSPRTFIADKNNSILFNCITESWDEKEKKWVEFPQYRVFPVKREKIHILLSPDK